MLNCLTTHLEKGLLLESQCDFQVGWGTVDMIFTARQLQEKCQEQRCDLYTTFVDLTKAFDTVSRDGLWKILAKYGCPKKFISIVWHFYDGMRAHVQNVFHHSEDGICIIYQTDGKLHNQCHLKAVTKVKQTVIRYLLFADDCALNVTIECNMQYSLDRFSTACDNFGLTISTKKNWGYVPTSSWQTLSQALHNHKRHSAKWCREVYLSGKYNLKAYGHWWGSYL